MLPFNKAQIFTLFLQLITLTFILHFGQHLLLGKHTVFSQNQDQGNTTKNKVELTASLHQLNCRMQQGFKIVVLKFLVNCF
jgi:hypothetical protein